MIVKNPRLALSLALRVWLLALCCRVGFAQEATTPTRAEIPHEQLSVFSEYCLECHDAATSEGGVNLETLDANVAANVATAETWQKVLNAMNSGEMPPDDSEPIADEAKTAFLDVLSVKMVNARKILGDSGGVITMRRLNRREYQNSVETLLGVRPDVSTLPDDRASSEFDTLGASLFMSSDQIEQYMAVARETLEMLNHTKPQSVTVSRVQPEVAANKKYAAQLEAYEDTIARAAAFAAQSEKPPMDFGFIDKAKAKKAPLGAKKNAPQLREYLQRPESKTGSILISTIKMGLQRVTPHDLPVGAGGQYILRVKAGVYPTADDRYQYIEVTSRPHRSTSSERLGWRRVTGTLESPQIIEFPITHPFGKRVQYSVHQRTHQGRGDKNLWGVHHAENGIGTMPGVWVDWAEIEGPIDNGESPSKRMEDWLANTDNLRETEYVKDLFTRFSEEAFRGKSSSPEFVEKLLAIYSGERSKGRKRRAALVGPLSVILASPRFLYMAESASGVNATALSGTELATRLSYFLWSEPPDEALMALAQGGELADSAVLMRETTRLLSDPRAERFVRSFVYQWLELERLEMFQYLARLYPTFDNATRESAREEIYQTVLTMMKEGLPLSTLLKADFVVVNDVLADYYGLEGVEGHAFRKVILPPASPRGGLLGNAAVLAMGSDGIRSSAVERGAWVLRHLLHNPPPPAPANVPQLSRLDEKPRSARDLQRAHMEEPQCAQCHRRIDPIGYGLENFDAAGGWRDVELVKASKRGFDKFVSFPIDPRGKLPNGREFSDYFGLREAVGEHTEEFSRGFTEALIAYGLGRPYGFTDKELADDILRQGKDSDDQPTAFIHALIQSKAFRSK